MSNPEQTMDPAQMAALVDGALECPHPLAFLNSAAIMFKMIGREEDEVTTTWIASLYARGEVEILMGLRAAWMRGEVRSPIEAARCAVLREIEK